MDWKRTVAAIPARATPPPSTRSTERGGHEGATERLTSSARTLPSGRLRVRPAPFRRVPRTRPPSPQRVGVAQDGGDLRHRRPSCKQKPRGRVAQAVAADPARSPSGLSPAHPRRVDGAEHVRRPGPARARREDAGVRRYPLEPASARPPACESRSSCGTIGTAADDDADFVPGTSSYPAARLTSRQRRASASDTGAHRRPSSPRWQELLASFPSSASTGTRPGSAAPTAAQPAAGVTAEQRVVWLRGRMTTRASAG